jgi:hypothetical protein
MNQLIKDESITNALILNGDLSKLTPTDKIKYYNGYCVRLGLDSFTRPFEILRLQGKEILYLTRSGAQQLNKLHNVSHMITSRELIADASVYQVTARASLPDGRFTESIGAVNIGGLKGDNYANAIMKCETKAKRRSTLDLLGLGVLDETEVETLNGQVVEIKELPPITIEAFNKALELAETDPTIYEKAIKKYKLTEPQKAVLLDKTKTPAI